MALRRDKIVVIDIEATCWDSDTPPDGQVDEIIEIGICIYDVTNDQIDGKRGILVKPVTSEISRFCSELTTLTPELIAAKGLDFQRACHILVDEYQARKYLWASWGSFDQKLFRKQCRRLKVSYPFGDKHLNVRTAFADANSGKRVGLVRALEMAALEGQGRLHRGPDDAWNCARLLQHLVTRSGIDFIKRYW